MKVNDRFRCGEEIYVENESDPTCGSDMVEFPPWDQCVSKPYVYSLFSFKKDKIDICPFTSPLHSDAIPVCLKYTWPLYFESNNVDMDVNGEDDNCFVYFLYTTEDDGGSGSTLFRFSTASKRVIQISRDEDQVLSFCLNDGKGLYTATWYQGNQKYWGIFLFQGRYPFTVYNIYEIEESTVDWQDSDTVSPTPQVQYKDGTYFVSSFPYDDKSSGEIKRCFLKISIEFGSKIVIETIPALSDLLITEMIFLGNTLICIDSTSPFPHFGKGVQKVYSYCSDTNKRSLLTTACGCCNLSGKENVLFFELQGLDNEESGLVWNKLDETHQSILETKNCTDFSGVVFDGSRLAATEWNSCGYDGDEERISFFHLPSGEVTHIERVFDDLIQLTLHDKYLFVYSNRFEVEFGYFDLSDSQQVYIPIMTHGKGILDYLRDVGQAEEWNEKKNYEQTRQQRKDQEFLGEFLEKIKSYPIILQTGAKSNSTKGTIINCLRKKTTVLQIQFSNGDIRYYDKDALGKTLFVVDDSNSAKLLELKRLIDIFSNNIV